MFRFQVPLIFIGNGTLGKTAWKSPKALKEYVDGAVFVRFASFAYVRDLATRPSAAHIWRCAGSQVSYPEKYLPKYDGVKCKSDKYIERDPQPIPPNHPPHPAPPTNPTPTQPQRTRAHTVGARGAQA
jgi:hypothetical protein